jgi:hypothetical protein
VGQLAHRHKGDQVHNMRRPKTNTSGFKGVSSHGKRWRATIGFENRRNHIGI